MTEAPKLANSNKATKAQLIPANRLKSEQQSKLNQTTIPLSNVHHHVADSGKGSNVRVSQQHMGAGPAQT
jgi:hypothetical protein